MSVVRFLSERVTGIPNGPIFMRPRISHHTTDRDDDRRSRVLVCGTYS